MAFNEAAGSLATEAYWRLVRRGGWTTENDAGEHFQQPVSAEVAELADALDSGSSALRGVRVQIPASAPSHA